MADKKKIIILIPVFERLEIFKLCTISIIEMMHEFNNKYDIEPIIIISNNDPGHLNVREICKDLQFTYIYQSNKPIGNKLNIVIDDIYRNIKFDYLMNFGSDNLVNPELLTRYEQYINIETPFFGINNVYLYDILTKRCVLFDCMAIDHAVGAGRMIHWSIIDHLQTIKQPLYQPEYSSGLDSCSASIILFNCNTREQIIDVGMTPYIMDIKNDKNINTFESLYKAMPQRMKDFDFDLIYRYFGRSGETLKLQYYDNQT